MKAVKYTIGIVLCNLYRLLRFIPNNDPVMGVMLPFARQDKWWHAGLFALLTMVSFDLITNKVGVWTAATAITYAGLGVMFHFAYKGRERISIWQYLGSGVAGVLIYDFITGPILSTFMFAMPFEQAFLGQIPFTLLHLASVSASIAVLTPLLDKYVVQNENLEDSRLIKAALG